MRTTHLNSLLKFYVMGSPQIDLYDIAHVKVGVIAFQKMYVILMLGRFVWTTSFVQCTSLSLFMNKILIFFTWWTICGPNDGIKGWINESYDFWQYDTP